VPPGITHKITQLIRSEQKKKSHLPNKLKKCKRLGELLVRVKQFQHQKLKRLEQLNKIVKKRANVMTLGGQTRIQKVIFFLGH
jgi:hypothetical protein